MKYVIDAWNLLYHPLFKRLIGNTETETCINLCKFLNKARINYILIFDGYFEIPPMWRRFVKFAGKERMDADDFIVNYLLRYPPKNKGEIMVVSNDNHLQMRVRSLGARALKIEEFYHRVLRQRIGKNVSSKELSLKQQEEITRELLKEFKDILSLGTLFQDSNNKKL